MRGRAASSLTAAAAAVALAFCGSAVAAILPPTPNPLPGSDFQGADGDQVSGTAGQIDWADLQARGLVAHIHDDNANDDGFEGGTKNGSPEGWSFKTSAGGVTPGGTNVRDAYASVDVAGGQTFLYLAAIRDSDTGTSYVSFELNRDPQLWQPNPNRSTLIPCRRDGDLMITYQPQGSRQFVAVSQWQTTTADLRTGCARVGTLRDVTGLAANVDVQGAFNPSAIATNVLPSTITRIETRLFSEAAVNLTAVLGEAQGDPCGTFASMWIYSHTSNSATSNMSDIVGPVPFQARTCGVGGTKFLDRNVNGVRDDGEPGIEGFKIFADYDNDGVQDPGEPFTYTDHQGNYVIDNIARRTYTVREEVPSGLDPGDWRCSHPNATTTAPAGAMVTAPGGQFACGWMVDRVAEPFARDRDFGDWPPARLTIEKRVFPAGDPTRFTISHPGSPTPLVLGNGESGGGDIPLGPGTYEVAETPHPDFLSHIICSTGTAALTSSRAVTANITLQVGDHGICRVYNRRHGQPGISIFKTGPAVVMAGETIHYTITVTNVGDVPFAADDVKVTDAGCDDEPVRVSSGDTLEPGAAWTYTCSKHTERTVGCEARTVENRAGVAAGDLTGQSSVTTEVRCPQPEIALVKTGERIVAAGSVIRYTFFVFNTGDTSFPAGDADDPLGPGVRVTDERCDEPPVVGAKHAGTDGDESPRTFDPGDTWVFTCLSVAPSLNEAGECTGFTVTNRATADAADDDGLSALSHDSWVTQVTCTPPPEPPVPPEPPAPPAPEPGPVLPMPDVAVPAPPVSDPVGGASRPPTAGSAGVARSVRLPSLRRCIRRGAVVRLAVARARTVELRVGGRRLTGIDVRPLQSRVVLRVRRTVPPGRHRIEVVVRFQSGADTHPLRFVRTVVGCAAAKAPARPPAVTG